MEPSQVQVELRKRFFEALVTAVLPLKSGPDPEVTLEMLIQAANMLKEHLEKELDEIRLEQVE
jgi:hypothetical protein